MSAFEVETVHIDVLVSAALQMDRYHETLSWYWGNPSRMTRLELENAGQVGAMLVAENRRSVNFRYSEDELEEPYEFTQIVGTFDPVKVLGALSCYEYQACECDDWTETEAYAFCVALRSKLIHALPGYQDAPWTVTDAAQVTIGAPMRARRIGR
jgi:hypothetical protein